MSSSPQQQSDFGHRDITSSEESEAEDAAGSEDADFDMDDSPAPAPASSARIDRSTSHDSRRPSKRKLGVEEDEFIKANPELYGIRRSVCSISILLEPRLFKLHRLDRSSAAQS